MFGGTCGARQLTIVLACAFLVLGACNDGPQPIEPPPSASVTIAPLEMPEAAKADTEEGALAFVEYYIEVFNYSANTGDTDLLRSLSHPDCSGCDSYATTFESQYSNGGYSIGFEWRPRSMETNGKVVETEIRSTTYRDKESSASEELQIEAAAYSVGFELTRKEDSPLVAELYEVLG